MRTTPEAMGDAWGIVPNASVRGAREGLSAGLWRFETDEPFEVASEPDRSTHILSPLMSGELDCELFIDGQRHHRATLRPGTFNLVRAGERPRAIEYRARCTFLHLYLPDATLQRYVEDVPGAPRVELQPLGPVRDATVQRIAADVHAEMRQGGAASRLIVDGLTLQLTGHLVRTYSNVGAGPARARGGLAGWQLRRACDAMEAALDGDIGLDVLAGLAGCSPTHFSRAFKQSTGLPPSAWLLARRIERAKELLDDPTKPLADIALAVGFHAQPQFTTAFKRATGTTPGAWRRDRLF